MKSDYAKLFQIPGDSYVSSWESPYVGTEQALFQCSTLNVREAYHAAGLKLQAEGHFPDDHIAAMMEYLAYMGARATIASPTARCGMRSGTARLKRFPGISRADLDRCFCQ